MKRPDPNDLTREALIRHLEMAIEAADEKEAERRKAMRQLAAAKADAAEAQEWAKKQQQTINDLRCDNRRPLPIGWMWFILSIAIAAGAGYAAFNTASDPPRLWKPDAKTMLEDYNECVRKENTGCVEQLAKQREETNE